MLKGVVLESFHSVSSPVGLLVQVRKVQLVSVTLPQGFLVPH